MRLSGCVLCDVVPSAVRFCVVLLCCFAYGVAVDVKDITVNVKQRCMDEYTRCFFFNLKDESGEIVCQRSTV